jgi:hypothetical protein
MGKDFTEGGLQQLKAAGDDKMMMDSGVLGIGNFLI